MKAEFWHRLWDRNEIGFHNEYVNKLFLENFPKLELKKHSRIFIPLCGKTVDIKWLLDNNYKVVGIELNEKAVNELFNYLKLKPTVKKVNNLILYSALNIDIFLGDIFQLDIKILDKIDMIYDRGAIVALPSEMRKNYTSHLINITEAALQLIITYEYNQNIMKGPPFSVEESQLKNYYNDYYNFKLLELIKPIGSEKLNISEKIWLLSPNNI